MEDYKAELKKIRKGVRNYQTRIAKEAEVSQPTVSRILNGQFDLFPKDTIDNVLAIARKYVKIAIQEKEAERQRKINSVMRAVA